MKQKLFAFFSFVGGSVLAYSAWLFFQYNAPIIKNLPLLAAIIGLLVLSLPVLSIMEFFSYLHIRTSRKLYGVFLLISSGLLVFAFLQSAVLDYFQPFSLYDDVIYLTLAAFLVLVIRFVVDAILLFIGSEINSNSLTLAAVSLLVIASLWAWSSTQTAFAVQHAVKEPVTLFQVGMGAYDIYRIPSLITIPKGAKLADGSTAAEDIVLAYVEARRNGSLDDGDVDLVMRRSLDGASTWSDVTLVRAWEDGTGKIGNATPVFDAATGTLFLFHIAGPKPPYEIWLIQSPDGGQTYSQPEKIESGIVGPGHGIQTASGRLVIPAHVNGSSLALYSDDHGMNWSFGEPVGTGNESEIAESAPGTLMMAVRTNHPVARPHPPLQQLFAYSTDDGQTWTEAQEHTDVRTPIVMTSILLADGVIYFSYPDDFHSRARMTIARSFDQGETFTEKYLVYPGPSGYSEMTALTSGDVLLVFENGAVEYDEQITLITFAAP